MSSLNVRLSQLADDMGIWAHATNAKWVKAKLSKALKLIESWCSKWRIKLNAGKTQLIVFSVGPKPELVDLELFGEPIIQTQTAKLLGILFDRRLSFKDYMKDLMTKVYRRQNLLKLLKGTNWGARPYTMYLKSLQVLYTPCPWILFPDNWSFKGITSEGNADLLKQVPETSTWCNLPGQNENNRSAWPH